MKSEQLSSKGPVYLIVFVLVLISITIKLFFQEGFNLFPVLYILTPALLVLLLIFFGKKPTTFYGLSVRVILIFFLMSMIIFSESIFLFFSFVVIVFMIGGLVVLLNQKFKYKEGDKKDDLGTIYFDDDCSICTVVKKWFQNSKTNNLNYVPAANYEGEPLLQVTYVNHTGMESKSIKAIASAMDHINFAYSILAWIMRLPVIADILQAIINSLGLGERQQGVCEV